MLTFYKEDIYNLDFFFLYAPESALFVVCSGFCKFTSTPFSNNDDAKDDGDH
jgi:hypothetical protein